MMGVGATEFAVIIVIALVLFGAPVLTFLVGYSLGKKKLADMRSEGPSDTGMTPSGSGSHHPRDEELSTMERHAQSVTEEHADE